MSVGARTRRIVAVLLVAVLCAARPGAGASPGTARDTLLPQAAAAESVGAPATGLLPTPKEQPATPESVIVTPRVAVPVFLGGREIFRVRAVRDGRDPAKRAAAIRARLDAAVLDTDTPADSVHLLRTTDGIEVRLGDHYLWTITRGDIEGLSVAATSAAIGNVPARVSRGILQERAKRSPTGIASSVLIALGITLVAWVLARLLKAAGQRWRALLSRTLPRYLGGIRIGSFDLLSQAQLHGFVGGTLGRIDLLLDLLLLYVYMTAVFSLFPWSQGWSWKLLSFAREELTLAAIAIGKAIPGLLVIAAVVILFRWLTGISDRFFDAIDTGALRVSWAHQELARPTKRIVRVVLWITAAMIAYPYIPGSSSKAVQGVSILVGVMVSLGSSGIVGNMMAGLVLTYTRAFRSGDRVRLGEHVGTITSLGFFATKLRTVWNEEVTLPNGQVAAQPILNFTRLAHGEGLVLHTQVTIGYDADWRTVHALLIEAAGRVEGIEPEPEPFVLQRSLNEFHITYEINCMTRRPDQMRALYSRLHEEIQDAFARAGVEILSPAYHALRDANAPVLPEEPKGPRAEPGGFRIRPERA